MKSAAPVRREKRSQSSLSWSESTRGEIDHTYSRRTSRIDKGGENVKKRGGIQVRRKKPCRRDDPGGKKGGPHDQGQVIKGS